MCCECKNHNGHHICKKGYIWNPTICICENNKHLASIIDDSMITYDEIIEETKTVATIAKLHIKEMQLEKLKMYRFYLLFLINIALLIDVNIYFCLIKCKANQKLQLDSNPEPLRS